MIKKYIKQLPYQINKYTHEHPYYTAGLGIALYTSFDYLLFSRQTQDNIGVSLSVTLALAYFYFVYAYRHKNKVKFLILLAVILGTVSIFPMVQPSLFPNITLEKLTLLTLLAPLMEETAYRYLLYDKTFSKRFGKTLGLIIVSVIFMLLHPISSLTNLAFYWIPSIALFFVYKDFGIYGSMLAHYIINLIVLLL